MTSSQSKFGPIFCPKCGTNAAEVWIIDAEVWIIDAEVWIIDAEIWYVLLSFPTNVTTPGLDSIALACGNKYPTGLLRVMAQTLLDVSLVTLTKL